jgi:hypothetical protein
MFFKKLLHLIHSFTTKMHNELVPCLLLPDILVSCQCKLGNELLGALKVLQALLDSHCHREASN